MMKKALIPGILFFGTIWGFSEVFLGESLYRAGFRFASVPLSIVALAILSTARAHFSQMGSSTCIACCAMLYKWLAMLTHISGTPIFPCHLLGIFTLGLAYDVVFSAATRRNKSICAAVAVYASYTLFALAITYVFRYQPWIDGGLPKILRHIGVSGTLASIGGAIVVPLSFRLAGVLKKKAVSDFPLGLRLAVGGATLVTAVLWFIGITIPA